MAGLDARHSEERHFLAGRVKRASPCPLWDGHLHWFVGHSLPVTVDLLIQPEVSYEHIGKTLYSTLGLKICLPVCYKSGNTV